eukprot:368389_1
MCSVGVSGARLETEAPMGTGDSNERESDKEEPLASGGSWWRREEAENKSLIDENWWGEGAWNAVPNGVDGAANAVMGAAESVGHDISRTWGLVSEKVLCDFCRDTCTLRHEIKTMATRVQFLLHKRLPSLQAQEQRKRRNFKKLNADVRAVDSEINDYKNRIEEIKTGPLRRAPCEKILGVLENIEKFILSHLCKIVSGGLKAAAKGADKAIAA